ncbi:hypothetical protein N665_2194s0003 [Sinapis alba]|nr:hypothetical protein N665_2194s0003 [Sinapis alba]
MNEMMQMDLDQKVLDGCLSNLWTTAPHRRFSWQVNKLLKVSFSLYEYESRNHLFFSCSFSWNIWPPFALRCGLQSERSWDRVMVQIQAIARNSSKVILLRICWQASIYWIWAKMNARIHRQSKDMILCLRDSNPLSSSYLMQQWLV